MRQPERGFTLIELLIVVVIIGILAAIAIPKFSSTRERAYLAAMRADLKNLAVLEEVYYNQNYTFSTDLAAVGFTGTAGVTITVQEADRAGWSADAVHPALPSDKCALFHGGAAPLDPATTASVVQCTR